MPGWSTMKLIFCVRQLIEMYREIKKNGKWFLLTQKRHIIESLGRYYGEFLKKWGSNGVCKINTGYI